MALEDLVSSQRVLYDPLAESRFYGRLRDIRLDIEVLRRQLELLGIRPFAHQIHSDLLSLFFDGVFELYTFAPGAFFNAPNRPP